MAELFSIYKKELISELETHDSLYEDKISLLDIFEIYIKCAQKSTNMFDANTLRGLIFKQFQNYGDFDKQMQEASHAISRISESTQDVVTAIEKNDQIGIKNAYDTLKKYQARILELEKNLYTDDLTKAMSRKYLFNHILDKALHFKKDGRLFGLGIIELEKINAKFGPSVADSVLRNFSRTLMASLKTNESKLIRYTGNEFILLALSENAAYIEKLLKDTQKTFETKKFKAPNGEILRFNFECHFIDYKEHDLFDEIFIAKKQML